MKRKTKTLLLCGLIVLLTAVSAVGILYLSGTFKKGNGNVLGVAWYHENETEFEITTEEQLYDLARLSEHYDFEGQTIKLGADIVINEGNPNDWEYVIPDKLWDPINGFAGTFDGQGHTISGICGFGELYGVANKEIIYYPTGLFSNTQTKCVIKNLNIKNSLFRSDLSEGVGSITNSGVGTFENIYSDALIITYKSNNGGLIGKLDGSGSSTIRNCWFDGEIRVEGNVGRYTGGIVGRVCNTGGQNKIEHCLNTGKLTNTVTGKGVNMGGLVGNIAPSGRLTLTDCLNAGELTNEYSIAVGSVIGNVEGEGSATINDVYAVKESYAKVVGNVSGQSIGSPIGHSESRLTGYEAYRWTTLNFDEYWAVVEDGTPMLKYYAEEVPSLKGIKKAFNTDWYSKSSSQYVLKTKEDLYGFAMLSYSTNFSGRLVKLGADIVLNEGDAKEWSEKAPENEWLPIGTVSNPFAGIFDGDMHFISGLYLNSTDLYTGLFSATTSDAKVQKVKVVNSYLKSSGTSFATIAGRGRGTFDTIYTNAYLESSAGNIGGIIGQVPGDGGVLVQNCWFDGNILATSNDTKEKRTGGIIGFVISDSTIKNCLFTGKIDASVYTCPNSATSKAIVPLAGGFVGHVNAKKTLHVQDGISAGEVLWNPVATAGYGSVVGWSDGQVALSGIYATEEGCSVAAGGTVSGYAIVKAKKELEGTKGYQWTHLDFQNIWAATSSVPVLKVFATDIISIAGTKKMVDVSWYQAKEKVYKIDSVEDLYGLYILSNFTNFKGKTIKLTKDITINKGTASTWANHAPANKWTPISSAKYPFAGTFDGGMHTISGLYLKTDSRHGGLFAATADTAVIKRLKITNSYLESAGADFGSLAGLGRGTFDTIYSDAIVVGSKPRMAGLIGQMGGKKSIVTNCWFDGKVTNTCNNRNDRGVGGLFGLVNAEEITVSNCLNTGTVDVTSYTFNQNPSGSTVIAPLAGGILSNVNKGTKLELHDSLSTGVILKDDSVTAGYGSITGWVDGEIVVSDVFASNQCARTLEGNKGGIRGSVHVLSDEELFGVSGYQWTTLDFDTYWAVVTQPAKAAPILRAFATQVPSLAAVNKMVDTSWYDSDKKEYILWDAADLYGLAYLSKEQDFKGKTVKLGANIVINEGNASDWDTKAPEYGWKPIGSQELPFGGTFDGCMHSISGVYLKTDVRFSGLFAMTRGTATVKRLKITNSYFTSSQADFGSVAGAGYGSFISIYSNAIVKSSSARVGGIIGQLSGENAKIVNCWFDGSVKSTGNTMSERGIGGLIGLAYTENGSISHCLNTGSVDATTYTFDQDSSSKVMVLPLAGGLIGQVHKGKNIVVKDSLNVGSVQVSSAANIGYGSIVGYIDGTLKTSETYATKESSSVSSGSNNLIGKVFEMSVNAMKGYEAYQWTLLDFDKYWAVVLGDTPILQSFAAEIPSLSGIERMLDFSWYDEEKDTYVLSDKQDLYGFTMLASEKSFKGKTIQLKNDIVINEGQATEWEKQAPKYTWTPIGSPAVPFEGTFDGGMHTVEGIYINTNARHQGLFAVVGEGGVVRNLKLTNSFIKSTGADVGSIAGLAKGTFDSIYSSAIVHVSTPRVGGMFGQISGTNVVMNQCWFDGLVKHTGNTTSNRGVGGIAGYVYTGKLTMTNSLNTGVVDVQAYTYNQSSTGKIVAPLAGGLVGLVENGASVDVSESIAAGRILTSASATNGYGSALGFSNSPAAKCVFKDVYATEESCVSTNGSSISGTVVKVKELDIKGENAKNKMPLLDWNNTWTDVAYGIPTLKNFEDLVIDISWYDEAKSSYLLKDKADLYGFAVLSKEHNFAGKTVTLGADIALNVGTASDWETGGPNHEWIGIGTRYVTFAGIFDGDMHTISGLYIDSTERFQGLFCAVGEGGVVKNLRLTNSFVKSTGADIGSIAGLAKGTFDAIYSSAIVHVSTPRVGGMFGQISGSNVVMNRCWFDGLVEHTGNTTSNRGVGAVAGYVYTGKLIMTNSLNTGTLDVKAYTYNQSTTGTVVAPLAGGLVGHVESGASVDVSTSIAAGRILTSASATNGYGSALGFSNSPAEKCVFEDVYATEESCVRTVGSSISGTVVNVKETDIKGENAKSKMQGLDFNTTWSIVENGLPILSVFAK